MKRRGALIAIEGISGSGKSEGIKQLIAHLDKSGFKTFIFEWNSNKFIRKSVFMLSKRKLLSPFAYSILQWLGFIIEYFLKILPLLRKNHIVIADRYFYTGITRDAVNGTGRWLGNLFSHIVREPDILLFFDTDPQVCYERIKSRGKQLFHTNRLILENKLLKNKELYYLKKLRNEYMRVLSDKGVTGKVKVIFVDNGFVDITVYFDIFTYAFEKDLIRKQMESV